MEKISRYILVLVTILGLSVTLPGIYWTAFEKPIRAPFVRYSCIDNDFTFLRSQNGVKRSNSKGEELSREAYELKLPLMYIRQLLLDKTMPEFINGEEIDLHEISQHRTTFRLKPKDIQSPKPTLFPLFESQSGRANLEMPDDFFRITWRMEFLDAASNKIKEEKSRMFSAVLYKRGFQFPAKSINGLPTTRKSCDEGYLLVDSGDQIFHLKMIEGKPFVEKVENPRNIKFTSINCVDFKDKFYYAYLFSEDNEVYVLTQYDYILQKLDVDDVNANEYDIRIYGDFFNYEIITTGENFIRSQVLDKNYEKIDEYTETWLSRDERREGKIAKFLFRFQTKTTHPNSGYVKFFTEFNKSWEWLITSLLLVISHFIVLRRRKLKVRNHIVDLFLIAATGIFGFFAISIFPNKFYY